MSFRLVSAGEYSMSATATRWSSKFSWLSTRATSDLRSNAAASGPTPYAVAKLSARRVYNLGLDEFIAWFTEEPRPAGFTKATVTAWRVALEARKLGPISINVRITAVRKLAVEAADNGLLAPELAAGIARIKGVRSHGVRVGNWLSLRQAQALLNTPDISTKKGLRDRAMFATLLGCGLRRSELTNLTMKHVQQRDSRWCIVDLVGKHGRVRTIPMPAWVKNAIVTTI